MFVANHVSYLDIPVLGFCVDVVFVAKQEVKNWPIFGFLARMAGTQFVKRDSLSTAIQCSTIRETLNQGNSILFFPEGTSSDGATVLPFKSSLFSAATGFPPESELYVQPVTIAYNRTPYGAPFAVDTPYSWYGDMTLLPHLLEIFEREGAEVDIIFHKPVLNTAFESRKELAEHCHAEVARGVIHTHVW